MYQYSHFNTLSFGDSMLRQSCTHLCITCLISIFTTHDLNDSDSSVRVSPWQWRHNERDGVSNHQRRDCLLNRLFSRRWQKTSKLRVTGLCAGNSPVTGEFPAQRASNAENVSIRWRHHAHNDSPLVQIMATDMSMQQPLPGCMVTYVCGHIWSSLS